MLNQHLDIGYVVSRNKGKCEKLALYFDISLRPRIFLLDYAALSGNSWIHDKRGEKNNKVEKYFWRMDEGKGK